MLCVEIARHNRYDSTVFKAGIGNFTLIANLLLSDYVMIASVELI